MKIKKVSPTGISPSNKPPIPIYIRVSSEDQVKGSGLPIQLRDCKVAVEREGFSAGQVFADEGESAKTSDRPQFLKLMEFIKERRPPAVVVWKLDRFARNSLDSQLFRAKLKEHGTRLISATEAIPDDFSGKLFADILSALAEYDNSLRAERCRNGMAYRAQEGWWVSPAPVGYLTARSPEDKPTLAPDPDKAPLVQLLFQMIADGHSQNDARREATRRGLRSRSGKPLTPQGTWHCLSNPVYAGWLTGRIAGDAPIKGKWPPIVSQELFDRVQLRMRKGKQVRREVEEFPLRGMLSCPKCGKLLVASYSKGRGGEYRYYHCHDCTGVRARCEIIEAVLLNKIQRLSVNKEMLNFMELILRRHVTEAYEPAKKERERLQKRLTILDNKIDRLVEMRLEGSIPRELYETKFAALDEERLMTRMDYHESDQEKLDIVGEFNRARTLLSDPGAFWQSASLPEKQAAFTLFFSSPLKLHLVKPKSGDKKVEPPKLEGSTNVIWYTKFDAGRTPKPEEITAIIDWLRLFRASKIGA